MTSAHQRRQREIRQHGNSADSSIEQKNRQRKKRRRQRTRRRKRKNNTRQHQKWHDAQEESIDNRERNRHRHREQRRKIKAGKKNQKISISEKYQKKTKNISATCNQPRRKQAHIDIEIDSGDIIDNESGIRRISVASGGRASKAKATSKSINNEKAS